MSPPLPPRRVCRSLHQHVCLPDVFIRYLNTPSLSSTLAGPPSCPHLSSLDPGVRTTPSRNFIISRAASQSSFCSQQSSCTFNLDEDLVLLTHDPSGQPTNWGNSGNSTCIIPIACTCIPDPDFCPPISVFLALFFDNTLPHLRVSGKPSCELTLLPSSRHPGHPTSVPEPAMWCNQGKKKTGGIPGTRAHPRAFRGLGTLRSAPTSSPFDPPSLHLKFSGRLHQKYSSQEW